MKNAVKNRLILAALAASLLACGAASAADQRRRVADPADAAAKVVPTRYTSFIKANASTPDTRSPAETWRERNQAVATYSSMAATMDMAPPPSTAPATATTGQPAAPARPATAPHHPGHP